MSVCKTKTKQQEQQKITKKKTFWLQFSIQNISLKFLPFPDVLKGVFKSQHFKLQQLPPSHKKTRGSLSVPCTRASLPLAFLRGFVAAALGALVWFGAG